MSERILYAKINRRAILYANTVMNALPRRAKRKQLEHWDVAYTAFKRGAQWKVNNK